MTAGGPWWAYLVNGASFGACAVLLTTTGSDTARVLAWIGLVGSILAVTMARHAARRAET